MKHRLFATDGSGGEKRFAAISAALALVLLLTPMLGGCAGNAVAPAPSEAVVIVEPDSPDESAEVSPDEVREADGLEPERQDGERFEAIIFIEGMEETVRYEHIRNEELGFEMDYDYENFERRSEPGRECFVSVWDDLAEPENYLELTSRPEDAVTAADAIGAALSEDYEIRRDDSFLLDGVGVCIRIDASAEVGGLTMPDQLQMVYVIPAADGCRVAVAHYAIEGSEGFGRRFHCMMDSFSLLPAPGER